MECYLTYGDSKVSVNYACNKVECVVPLFLFVSFVKMYFSLKLVLHTAYIKRVRPDTTLSAYNCYAIVLVWYCMAALALTCPHAFSRAFAQVSWIFLFIFQSYDWLI